VRNPFSRPEARPADGLIEPGEDYLADLHGQARDLVAWLRERIPTPTERVNALHTAIAYEMALVKKERSNASAQ